MKAEEIIGLIAILCAIFIFGFLIEIEYISLAILLIIGGLIFFVLYTKNSYAIFGVTVLIFVLLFYLWSQFKSGLVISFSENYLGTIILFLIIILGFGIAYKMINH